MVFNTLTVGAAVTPSVIETYFSHYLNRAPLRQKPTAHISYHEGLRLIREFLEYSSKHTVEDLQAFTAQWVPAPHWVRINDAEIAPKFLDRAAGLVGAQLGNVGLEKIGGKTWWQWRRPDSPLRAEWIEMKKEYQDRKRTGAKCERVILYVHGGAYYFGSVDEHRYQMQRHARKLKARVLAPRYRLAPQFPFPCGLYDCLATYFYLLEHFRPSEILFAGDSAGAGLVLSLLVVLRDQEQPLPAGTILLSPWVDLTHSFPSVDADGAGDYIPNYGFHHRPSMAWPPPPSDQIKKKPSATFGNPTDAVELPASEGMDMRNGSRAGDEEDELSALPAPRTKSSKSGGGDNLNIMLDGKVVEMKEQMQMYTTNELLTHPLVSPVMQPSLGGLPPMLIQVGGGELLKDEQMYLAHKAANPKSYPANEKIMREFDPQKRILNKYPPTDVQLQLWDDLCHVPHTLSFTRPAKYMYRSVAQFAAWALAHAQQRGIEIQNDDAVSFISSGEEDEDDKSIADSTQKDTNGDNNLTRKKSTPIDAVGKAGDPLPAFKDHMIRQRVTRHGIIYELAPASELVGPNVDPASIGVIKQGPVRKWLAARATSDQRFTNERKRVEKKRAKEAAAGYDEIPGENPPPTALINRRRNGVAPDEKKKGRSWGLAMWSGWGSSHDESTLQREEKTEKSTEGVKRKPSVANALNTSNGNLAVPEDGKQRRSSSFSMVSSKLPWSVDKRRGKNVEQEVQDAGQADSDAMLNGSSAAAATSVSRSARSVRTSESAGELTSRPVSWSANGPIPVDSARNRDDEAPIPTTGAINPNSEKIPGSENTYLSPTSSRPHNGVQAYPFKLRDRPSNPSIMTLDSVVPTGATTPASFGHSELAGDAPNPVELPSAADIRRSMEPPELPASSTNNDSSQIGVSNVASSTSAVGDTLLPPSITTMDVSPVEDPNAKAADGPISPVESNQKLPFKLRNKIFDARTSMLGSIGADGMPSAHHAFTEDRFSSPQPSETAPVNGTSQPTEATKAAPFKMRHTVYDPDGTLAKPATTEYEPVPSTQPAPTAEQANVQHKAVRESGTLGMLADQPPSYETMPLTNVIMPETVPRNKPIVKQNENDTPPPPPPKDEKHLSNRNKKPTGLRKTSTSSSGNGSAPRSKFSMAPVIGEMSFEAEKRDKEKRPELEHFVTAREGGDVKGV